MNKFKDQVKGRGGKVAVGVLGKSGVLVLGTFTRTLGSWGALARLGTCKPHRAHPFLELVRLSPSQARLLSLDVLSNDRDQTRAPHALGKPYCSWQLPGRPSVVSIGAGGPSGPSTDDKPPLRTAHLRRSMTDSVQFDSGESKRARKVSVHNSSITTAS